MKLKEKTLKKLDWFMLAFNFAMRLCEDNEEQARALIKEELEIIRSHRT